MGQVQNAMNVLAGTVEAGAGAIALTSKGKKQETVNEEPRTHEDILKDAEKNKITKQHFNEEVLKAADANKISLKHVQLNDLSAADRAAEQLNISTTSKSNINNRIKATRVSIKKRGGKK